MDAVDRKLLDLIQRDASLTSEKLAELVGASGSAVHRRDKINSSIADVGLEIERKQATLYERLQRWVERQDAVQQAYNVTGSSDFVIVVTAATVEEYDQLMDETLEAHPNIKKYTTTVVLRSFKRRLFVPVLPDDRG